MMSCDVVVIGGGIVGSSAAWYLMNHGLRVALIEQNKFGHGATHGSFASVSAVSTSGFEPSHHLSALGVRLHFEMSEKFGAQTVGFHHCGALSWGDSRSAHHLNALRDDAKRLRQWGYDIDWLERTQLIEHEPNVLFESGAAGIYAHADGWLQTERFIGFLVGQLRHAGALLLESCHVQQAKADSGGRVNCVITNKGTIDCANVVVAAGANTPAILAQLTDLPGCRLSGLLDVETALVVYTPAGKPLTKINAVLHAPDGGNFYLRTTPGGGYAMSARDIDAQIAVNQCRENLNDAVTRLLARADALVPSAGIAALRGACECVVNTRPLPADGFTIAGLVPGSSGLYLLVTDNGVTLAPALGQLLAESIVLAHPIRQLHPFDPSRFF